MTWKPRPHVEFTSREHAPAFGDCDTCTKPGSPLVLDPLAFALRGEFYTYLCAGCLDDREMEA